MKILKVGLYASTQQFRKTLLYVHVLNQDFIETVILCLICIPLIYMFSMKSLRCFSLLRIEMYLLHGRFPLKCAFTMYTMMRVRVYMEDQGVDKK